MSKRESHQSQVAEASLLLQAVRNTSSSLELFRESVSNSVDANCTEIDIKLTNQGRDLWDIVIQDDGHGMTSDHLAAFFGAGKSKKDFEAKSKLIKRHLAIGEKGLGSKTTFTASEVVVESMRASPRQYIRGTMLKPLARLEEDRLPNYDLEIDPPESTRNFAGTHGTRIQLRGVRIPVFNGKQCDSADDVATRLLHYLRSQCATGTVKNRFAGKPHIAQTMLNPSTVPQLTVEVQWDERGGDSARIGAVPGLYQVPSQNLDPSGGPKCKSSGVEQNSRKFCGHFDGSWSSQVEVRGEPVTVWYDVFAVVAGEDVRTEMLSGELKQGWTHKSQMGVHLCRDFIPLRVDAQLSRDLLPSEYYYEFKVFLNCQWFTLNNDRNVVTNLDHPEVSWIFNHFKRDVMPSLAELWNSLVKRRELEEAQIDAHRRSAEMTKMKSQFRNRDSLRDTFKRCNLEFSKVPNCEADVSHLLAMMIQSGDFKSALKPIERFGSYVDKATDLICEDSAGKKVLLVEVETELKKLFLHEHPMDSFEAVVVWTLGDLKSGYSGNLRFVGHKEPFLVHLQGDAVDGWRLKWGTHLKPVLVLSDILQRKSSKSRRSK